MADDAPKFFRGRRDLEIDSGETDVGGLAEYKNLPASVGTVISARLATLVECQTVLSIEDVYNLIEVLAVDANNRRVMAERSQKDK